MVATTPRMPGPTTLPVLGNFWNLRRDPRINLTLLAQRYGDRVQLWVAGHRFVVLSHPDDIEDLLVRLKDHSVKDNITRRLDVVLGQGLLTGEGEHWRTQRRRIAPSFQLRHLGTYVAAMVRSTVEQLPAAGPLDVHALTTQITLDIVVRTLFGAEPGDEAGRVGPLLKRLMAAFETEQRSLWRVLPPWVPGRHRVDVWDGTKTLDALLMDLVRRARQQTGGDSLLARLLAATDDAGNGMSDRELRDELVTLFLAGHETTSIALTMALYLLAEHPEHQQAVRDEVHAVAGDAPLTLEHTRALKFTEAVLNETMRLYPPAWAIGREMTADVEIRGHRVAAGTQMVASQWVVHHDPRWWVGPQWFRPQRWLNGETEGLPRLAFFPFGGGPRVCVGQHFAMLEATVVLAELVRARAFVSTRGPAPELVTAVTLRPRTGVFLRVAEPSPAG